MKALSPHPIAEACLQRMRLPISTFYSKDNAIGAYPLVDAALSRLTLPEIQELCLYYQCGAGELTSYILADKFSFAGVSIDEIAAAIREIESSR